MGLLHSALVNNKTESAVQAQAMIGTQNLLYYIISSLNIQSLSKSCKVGFSSSSCYDLEYNLFVKFLQVLLISEA